MDTKQRSISVLMLPWLAHGHISPFLELAKKLAKRNFHIYLCSTPINLNSIKKRLAPKYSHSIKLIELHLQSSPDLPPHCHTANGLPYRLLPALKAAFEAAIPALTNLLTTLAPDLFFYDFNQPWAPMAAAGHNILAVEFITTGSAMVSLAHCMSRKPGPGVEFPFPEIRLRGFHEAQFRRMVEKFQSGDNYKEGPLDVMKRSHRILLFNTFREMEGKYMDYVSGLTEKKIVPVGPLIQDDVVDEDENKYIIQWLHKKQESSTVFVSFGSEYFLSKEEVEEVAYGLELSQVNFIWVFRLLGYECHKTRVEEALPDGFFERVGERGLVVMGWAPQVRILAHSSIGGFVSHCGWNSIMESLTFGVPIIAMPMHFDQPSNARLVEEVGVSTEVEREEDGRLNREEIAKVIRKVVVEKDGEEIRIKAREFGENIKMKGETLIDELAQELMRLCEEREFHPKH